MVEIMSKLAFVYWHRKAHNEATKTEENLQTVRNIYANKCHMSHVTLAEKFYDKYALGSFISIADQGDEMQE